MGPLGDSPYRLQVLLLRSRQRIAQSIQVAT
jgi:hypothetical protein